MKVFLSIPLLFLVDFAFSQTINTEKSNIRFDVENMWVNTVEGSFKGMTGSVQFDQNNLSSSKFDVCIDASSVNTENNKRDEHLRNEDFFHVDKFPTICFKSSNVSRKDDSYLVSGKLTLHGVTKNISIPFQVNNNVFKGSFMINRSDFNLGSGTGKFLVSKEVNVTIECAVHED